MASPLPLSRLPAVSATPGSLSGRHFRLSLLLLGFTLLCGYSTAVPMDASQAGAERVSTVSTLSLRPESPVAGMRSGPGAPQLEAVRGGGTVPREDVPRSGAARSGPYRGLAPPVRPSMTSCASDGTVSGLSAGFLTDRTLAPPIHA